MSQPKSHHRPIVVVEENPDDLFLLTRRIKQSGSQSPIVNFFDIADAVAYFERALASRDDFALPCVVFTDLNLNGRDGFEIVEWIRAHPKLGDLKVFVMSGSEDPAHRRRADELEVDGYLLKFPSVEIIAQSLSQCR